VRNLAGFDPGAPAAEATLLDFQDRLLRTGLYDQATVALDTDNADPAGTPVIVRLKEAPVRAATFGVGISANTGPRVSVEHTHRRFFGERATLRHKLEVGRLRQAWEGELSSHAQPDLYRNLVGGTVERLVARDDGDVVRSMRARIARVQETTQRERSTFFELERADRKTALVNTAIVAASGNFHGTWRKVDNVLLPTEGWSITLHTGAGYARSNHADNGPYGRVLGRVGLWRPLPAGFYGQVRFEAAQVIARDSVALPETQLFRAGGDDSVRGYGFRSLGPIVDGSVAGGRVMTTASVEVARPVSAALPSVWWAVFADAGQAAQRWGELDPVWGAGVGVRWRSPVGPLRVDWAWGDATRKTRLHLSVGVVF
jgi:translocation and assembly module TamA